MVPCGRLPNSPAVSYTHLFTPQSDPNDPLIQYLFSDDNRLLAAGINGTIYELDVKSGAVLQTWEAKDPLIRISLAGDRLMAVTYSLSLIHMYHM